MNRAKGELPADSVVAALTAVDIDGQLRGDPNRAAHRLGEMARNTTDSAAAQGLEILASLASMSLDGDQWDAPYSPWFTSGNQRGFVPSDFTERDLDVLRWAARAISNVALSARAADIVWLVSTDRRTDLPYARLAIDKWAHAPVGSKSWNRGHRECITRAIELAKRMQQFEVLELVQQNLMDAIRGSKKPWFVGQVVALLVERGLVGERGQDLVDQLDRALSDLDPALNIRESLLESKARLLRKLDRESEAAEAEEEIVTAILGEAKRRSADSRMVEAHFLEEAYQKARRIPRKHRSEQMAGLIRTLPARIREAGEASIDEMTAFETSGDITTEVRAVREGVRGMELAEALSAMVDFAGWSRFEDEKSEAEKSLEGSIAGLFGGSTISSDGRKVDSTEVDNYYGLPSAVWHRMHFHYSLRISMTAIGVVVPAMEVISTEHRISLTALRYLVHEATIVPEHVKELFSLGLYYGVRHEWASALHILAPQVEAIVRYHLREAGVDTERIDPENSISTETGLSTLMKSEVADELFGPNLAWEIRALLCGPSGPNLRNLVAHGLISEGVANGPHAIYLWWFCMRLVFLPYYHRMRRDAEESEESEHEEEPDKT